MVRSLLIAAVWILALNRTCHQVGSALNAQVRSILLIIITTDLCLYQKLVHHVCCNVFHIICGP